MFKSLLIIMMVFSLGACEDTNKVSEVPANDDIADLMTMDQRTVGVGKLNGVAGHRSSGKVELIFSPENETYSLIFENFSSQNGPALRVYLSEGPNPRNYLDLGDLKSTSGTLRYDFKANLFDSKFDHALIWCDEFSVGFGEALLQPGA